MPKKAEPDWKQVATDALGALRKLNAHYEDLSKSNPGFMGKLCLQDYALWNEALISSSRVLNNYEKV